MGMGRNRWVARTSYEYDSVTAWRHVLAYMRRGRPKIHKQARRRERRQARQRGHHE